MTVLLLLFLFRLWEFLYFISIFISSSYTRFAQKFPENQKIKKFWPNALYLYQVLPKYLIGFQSNGPISRIDTRMVANVDEGIEVLMENRIPISGHA